MLRFKHLAMPLMLVFVIAFLLIGIPPTHAAGTISLTTIGSAYTQNFDTLATSGTANTTLPTGWELSESGTSARNNSAYAAGTGSDNAGDVYSFGASGNSERAYGTLRSGTLVPIIGASFTNNTGKPITSLVIAYTGEMWRAGVTNRGAADRLDFQLSTNATSLSNGTWVDYDSLDYNSSNINATAGALNGNAVGNRTAISFAITGLNIANGSTFWIRWTDFDIASSDDGLAIDDFSLTVADAAPFVASTTPANSASNVALNANITINFSEPVNVTGTWFTISCTSSGAHTATVSGGPSTFTLNPDADFVLSENCTLTVSAANVTDQDADDPPDLMSANFSATFSTLGVCQLPFTRIPDIQGSGMSAAITGNVTTQGVIVGDFKGSASASGFYIQDPIGDGNPATSDGIFVYTGSSSISVSVGKVVRVTGFARERFNQTTINGADSNSAAVPATNIVECGDGSVLPTDVTLPFADADFPERYEGMLVRFPQSLVIAEYFNYDRFGEIVLALPLPGEARPFTGTAVDDPGVPANARTLANSLRRITLDDANSAQNPTVLRHPNGQPFSLSNLFRGGDTVQNAIGVLGYDFNLYRIIPTGPADYTAANPRPATPGAVAGNLKVAAMNTLNYFLSLDYPTGNPLDNKCGPAQNVECRGADSDQPNEFTRQRTKLLAALTGLNADVIGLNEIENTTGVDPLANIVSGMPGYATINTGVIGTDAIRVGIIYKTSAVTPIGAFKLLTSAVDPRFVDTLNRPSLAQTFQVNANGARFTVVVNHLKSKGSTCPGDPDVGDGQGNCNLTRKAAAQALVDWLATDPTGSGDPDFLIMGDLNSYAKEDPVTAIRAGADDTAGTSDDYTNLIAQYQGAFAYSYVFDGQAGYLDHALASATLVGQVKGAVDWHINADEPDVLDYDTSFKPNEQDALYEPNAYRTSDHDAVLVGIQLNAPPTVNAGGPYSVNEGASVTVTASGNDPDGDALTYAWDLNNDGTFETPGQSATFSAAAIDGPATRTIKVRATDPGGLTATAQATVNILNAPPVMSANPATQNVQYSDPIATVTVTAKDVAADLPITTIATDWKKSTDASFTSGLPTGWTLSSATCNSTQCTWTLNGKAMLAPATYIVRVTATDKNGGAAFTDITFVVQQEDARATYTGALFASTSSVSVNTASVTLAATIQDITAVDPASDANPGDIRNATIAFVNRDAGNAVLCTAPIGLVNPADPKTGTATCTWNANIGNADSAQFTVGIVVNNYYTRNASADNTVVTVSKPLASEFITGGGYLVLTNSVGQKAGDAGSKNNFGFNVKYNKAGTNLQGNMNIIVRSGGRVYQIKGNALTSLTTQPSPCAGTICAAIFNGKANIQDITNPNNPISVDGNATLQVTLTDRGEPGSNDSIAITVWNKSGGVWFASKWDGAKTVEQTIAGGNLVVH